MIKMDNLPNDALLPDNIPELESEILAIESDLDDIDVTLRTLLAAEDPSAGIFHAKDIHSLRQKKLMLITSRDLRKVRIRRIRYAEGEQEQ